MNVGNIEAGNLVEITGSLGATVGAITGTDICDGAVCANSGTLTGTVGFTCIVAAGVG